MYKNASTGDWVEFADDAKKLHWVDVVIEEIHETSLIKNPDADGEGEDDRSTYYGIEEQLDAAFKARRGNHAEQEELDNRIEQVKDKYPKSDDAL